jgi:hypothetical protein
MASFFDRIRKVVDLGNGNFITLRSLTLQEQQEIQTRCMKVKVSLNNNSSSEIEIDAPLMTRLTWHRAIESWEGPGFEGRPVTPENIDQLPPAILEMLQVEYNSLGSLTETEKKI